MSHLSGITGLHVHGELSSADASTAAALILYTSDKAGPVARTLGAKERLVITDASIVAGAAIRVDLFNDADASGTVGAGERIVSGQFGANGGSVSQLSAHHYCTPGITPKVKASGAGQVDVIVHGVIISQ